MLWDPLLGILDLLCRVVEHWITVIISCLWSVPTGHLSWDFGGCDV